MGDLHGLKFDDAVSTKPEAYKAFSADDRNQEIPVTNFHSPPKATLNPSESVTVIFPSGCCILVI